MKLFRFMSLDEFQKYCNGEVLTNNTNHNKDRNKKTASVGFCFFNYADFNPEEILHSVTGIVNISMCAIFETNRENVRKSWGRYSKSDTESPYKREIFIAKEYCTTKYSKDKFKLLKYAIPNWFSYKWEWKEGANIGK